ncbi:hypothetical protein CGMCC3_g9849 [Colletotrichum fructicola]|nr:uncharacterized protein CGMCC3_g9849 [Colletotrichum fructicola]KAE9574169.1 hypothetical protein CGMCC3_g9849 [Colletotrichum fructicola]KAF4430882.1 hypothetical protein CFRS1_v009606 [Colletotrichum fructicola]KAF4881266.1 hypothetical protein CGCFRS4_v015728 [Colletotrichum fructicola]
MRTVRVENLSDHDLVKKCEEEISQRCAEAKWRSLRDAKSEPDQSTVALIVDMRQADRCAVYIHDTKDEFIGMVGMDQKGFVLVIPWQAGQTYWCSGQCRVAEIKAINDDST